MATEKEYVLAAHAVVQAEIVRVFVPAAHVQVTGMLVEVSVQVGEAMIALPAGNLT